MIVLVPIVGLVLLVAALAVQADAPGGVSVPVQPRHAAKLGELSDRFRPMAAGVLADLDDAIRREPIMRGVSYFLGDAFRSMEKSRALFEAYSRGGPRAAPPGSSPHNYREGLDVNLARGGAVIASASDPAWQRFGELVRARGAVWGGTFTGAPDAPHFEHPAWRELRTLS